jgi:glycosyltransferase involved in cell wall biosynthesis
MKILQLITGTTSFGGAEAHVRDLSIGLRARGHDCSVMVGPPEGLLSEQLRAAGVPVLLAPALKKWIHPIDDTLSVLQVISALRKLKPDIIAAHTAKAGFVGRIAAKLEGTPSFFTPHGLSFINRQTGGQIKHRLLLENFASHFGGKIIAVCEAERRFALKHLRIGINDISTIHNGLPDCVVNCQRKDSPLVITMIARFDRQKDHLTLLKALSTLKHLEWELRLAGTGPLLPDVIRFGEEYGLSPRIHFLNECLDTPRLLAESDIFVLSTNWEAFPISILEAMRAGLPVIATNTGGVSEAVEDGTSGFLVPRGDLTSLADRIALLLTSADLRLKLGSQSRLRFCRHFEWRSMLEKTEAAYAEALPKGAGSGTFSLTSA